MFVRYQNTKKCYLLHIQQATTANSVLRVGRHLIDCSSLAFATQQSCAVATNEIWTFLAFQRQRLPIILFSVFSNKGIQVSGASRFWSLHLYKYRRYHILALQIQYCFAKFQVLGDCYRALNLHFRWTEGVVFSSAPGTCWIQNRQQTKQMYICSRGGNKKIICLH
jgi:hypothetical protein